VLGGNRSHCDTHCKRVRKHTTVLMSNGDQGDAGS
jgi:hypothetical protein